MVAQPNPKWNHLLSQVALQEIAEGVFLGL